MRWISHLPFPPTASIDAVIPVYEQKGDPMIVTTTPSIQGQTIVDYKGIVAGEAIIGANVVRDFLAGITDIVGGRSGAYEQKLVEAREIAVREMTDSAASLGANAVVGVDIDYEVIREGMLMVTACGTAVSCNQS